MYKTSLSTFAHQAMNGLLANNYPDTEIVEKSWQMARAMFDKQEELCNLLSNKKKSDPAYIQERKNMLNSLLTIMDADKQYMQMEIAKKLSTGHTSKKFRAVFFEALNNKLIVKDEITKKYYKTQAL